MNNIKKDTKVVETKEISKERHNNALVFNKTNYILLAVGIAIVILGFILLSGNSSTPQRFDPEIFSTLHIKIAPMVCLFGFLFIIVAILWHKKKE